MDIIIINMANLEFPNVVGWTQQYFTGEDNIPTDMKLTSGFGMYARSNNTVIDVKFDTSELTDTQYMFEYCRYMVALSLFDTSKVANMSNMFSHCTSLTTVPLFDTSKVANMNNMFDDCGSLTSIPLLDTSNVTNINYIFGYSALTKLTYLGGFKNLGMQPALSINSSYGFNNAPNLTHKSVMNIINNLYDRKSAGYSVITLKFAPKTLALLSEDEIAIATNKGWVLS